MLKSMEQVQATWGGSLVVQWKPGYTSTDASQY